ncbi:MAG TPA: hydrogenase nickel incorporation protein HypA [Opitutales bacterium]|nr:hydrogenase nickel incorporation protein HypA [Opitutales bacterium]
MFIVDLTFGALIYIFSAISLLFGLWLFYDLRDKNLYEAERKKVIFHCIKCDRIYTDRQGTAVSVCPRCQFENARLKF